MSPTDSPGATLVHRLSIAGRVVALTGAGVSAESGIPTFRDPGGLWEQFRPEELANVNAFMANPDLVQGWYRHRRTVARECAPNPAHVALRDLEDLVEDFTLVTQNVDDLHRRAGSRNILELHGNIMRGYCIACGRPEMEAARCPECGGLIRPDVVWFGEMLPIDTLEAASRAADRAEVFLCIGTSALVYPAAGLPLAARRAGAYVAEFNVQPSAIAGDVDEVILGPAGETLPRLVSAVREARRSP
jgi:NAD-dependent deacetylase